MIGAADDDAGRLGQDQKYMYFPATIASLPAPSCPPVCTELHGYLRVGKSHPVPTCALRKSIDGRPRDQVPLYAS